MSEEKITTTSLEVIQTYNTETGLVVYAVSLDDLDKAINAMDKQAKRINDEKDALIIERDKLQTQVERLTKAGDAMSKLMFIDKDYIGSPKQEAVVEWCKATEGKQP